jgi:hypothetical protein
MTKLTMKIQNDSLTVDYRCGEIAFHLVVRADSFNQDALGHPKKSVYISGNQRQKSS